MSKAERRKILLTDEVYGFLEQSNISKKNVARLKVIEECGIEEVVQLAAVVREIALVKPHPRKRWGFIRRQHPEIYQRAADIGLIEDLRESLEEFDEEDRWEQFDDVDPIEDFDPLNESLPVTDGEDAREIPF